MDTGDVAYLEVGIRDVPAHCFGLVLSASRRDMVVRFEFGARNVPAAAARRVGVGDLVEVRGVARRVMADRGRLVVQAGSGLIPLKHGVLLEPAPPAPRRPGRLL